MYYFTNNIYSFKRSPADEIKIKTYKPTTEYNGHSLRRFDKFTERVSFYTKVNSRTFPIAITGTVLHSKSGRELKD